MNSAEDPIAQAYRFLMPDSEDGMYGEEFAEWAQAKGFVFEVTHWERLQSMDFGVRGGEFTPEIKNIFSFWAKKPWEELGSGFEARLKRLLEEARVGDRLRLKYVSLFYRI